jgi:hypothetical protein
VRVKCISRLTGFVQVVEVESRSSESGSKHASRKAFTGTPFSIGLNVKKSRENLEAVGFSKRVSSGWLYSGATVAVLKEYYMEWPRVFSHISANKDDDFLVDEELFPRNTYVLWVNINSCISLL